MHFSACGFNFEKYYLWEVEYQRANGHTVSRMTAHIVWTTKYRYPVLVGDIQLRCRTILKQVCEAEDVVILKGVVSKEHIHIEYHPARDI